jgi:amino acid adenylation domain-containing protein
MSTAAAGTNDRNELLTLPGLLHALTAVLGPSAGELDADDDLVGAGIDSIGIMEFANRLRASGLPVATADLMTAPTLGNWLELARQSAGELPARPAAADPNHRDDGTTRPALAAPALGNGGASDPFPLTPMQHAYWVGRLGSHPLSVSSHFYWELAGTGIDPERLDRAVRILVDRHPMLRARFLDDGRQQILTSSPWQGVTVLELADDAALAAVREEETNRSLAVDKGEVFDVRVSRVPGGRTFLHVNIDMLVADAASFRVFLDELAQLYDNPHATLPPLEYDIVRYYLEVERQRAETLPAAAEHWRSRLDTLPGPPQLPLTVDPALLEAPRVAKREAWVPVPDVHVLRDRCRVQGVTVAMALATAFAETVGRWCAEPRFLLNLPLFDRRPVHDDVPRLVGDFTNLLLLAVDRPLDVSFLERARSLQSRLREDIGFADYSGTDVLRDVARRTGGTMPTAPVVFTSVLGMGDIVGERVRRTFGDISWLSSQTPQVWLDHQVIECNGRLLLNWDAVDALFPPGCLDAMFDAYVDTVRWLGAPDTRWEDPAPAELPPFQGEVRRRVNDTSGEVSHARLQDAFVERAHRCPDALALAWGEDGTMTCRELRNNAEHLAARLQELGVTDEPVAISMPRGPRQVVAVLASLLAGTSYVPIGYDTPAARRERILATAGASVLVCADDAPPPEELPDGVRALSIGATVPASGELVPSAATETDLAYTIFTSGSTGEPKGVMVSHAAAVASVDALNDRCGLGPFDRVIGVSALDFDLSVYDIFGVLSVGGALVLVDESAHGDPDRWRHLVRHWGVTLWQSVPTLLEMLLATEGDLGDSLRLALVGGDWPALDLLPRLVARLSTCRLVALGGATETTIYSTWFDVTEVRPEWRSVPLGTPLRHELCRVVDPLGRDCPDWVPGELWIGGRAVADGYRGDPERTARQFVTVDGTRWYRTGDVACYHPDGNLEFLGRRDHQLKVRGHRIELGDVEASFRRCPGVRQAVAVGLGEAGNRRLSVAVTLDPGTPDDVCTSLRAQVSADLPPSMVPETVVVLDSLPLSVNGKVDRGSIERLLTDSAARSEDSEPPTGPTEQALAGVWRGLLRVDPGRTQSFFALGGDSLSATRFVQEARRTLGVEVPMRQLFDTPTIAELAAIVDAARGSGADGELLEEGLIEEAGM